jgi:hypothetical protein
MKAAFVYYHHHHHHQHQHHVAMLLLVSVGTLCVYLLCRMRNYIPMFLMYGNKVLFSIIPQSV